MIQLTYLHQFAFVSESKRHGDQAGSLSEVCDSEHT